MILAIDTATRWLGSALHDGTAVLAEHGWRAINTQTVELTPAIAQILARGGLTADDLKGIAVAIGPGSYTGLRVGLGVAKGLALANQKPLMGVSTLDIVAASLGPSDAQLIVTAEAGRTRIIAGVYQWHDRHGWQSEGQPEIETWEELLAGLERPSLIAGEVSQKAVQMIRKMGKEIQVAPAAVSVRRAGYLAELGWQRLKKGKTDDASSLAPIYLRNPDGSM
jgi:tRNA threonylcarbamoyladenosine biosynthesis protein TsaB